MATGKITYAAGRYQGTWWIDPLEPGERIVATIDAVKSHSDGRLTARLDVSAHTRKGELELYIGSLNVVSLRTRTSIAKELAKRFPLEHWRWDQILEDLCRYVIRRELRTERANILALREPTEPDYLVYPLVLDRLPTLWYGPGAAGKTMAGLYIALIVQNGLSFRGKRVKQTNVLYCDWEVDRVEAERRISYLARGLAKERRCEIALPYYRRCVLSIADEASEIAMDLAEHKIGLLIVDSAAAACGGNIQADETAINYFAALRKICAETSAASITLTHVTKAERRDAKQKRLPLGSVMFENQPRMTWEIRTSELEGEDRLLNFFCRKSNQKTPEPFGLRFCFGDDLIQVIEAMPEEPSSEEQLARDYIIEELAKGPMTLRELAQATETPINSLKVILYRLKKRGIVTRIRHGTWALLEHRYGDEV